jgi:hypothetical protein
LLLRPARSLGLGVPSLRDPSGRIAYGLLRCTSSRCIWLRQTVAALPPPDESLHSAFRRRPWIKIKSCSRANAHPVEWGGFAAWVVRTLTVGASLLAKAALQPTNPQLTPPNPCGSWLASDDGLTANQSQLTTPNRIVGVSLLAITTSQPTNLQLTTPNPCGSWLASDDGLPANQPPTDYPQSNCGSEPARESGPSVTTISPDPQHSVANPLPHLIHGQQITPTAQSPADTSPPPAPSPDSTESPTPTDPPADSRSTAASPYPPPKPAPAHR